MERLANDDPVIRQCIYCHRVLDDIGRWLEQEGTTGDNVSHDICPDCLPEARRQLQEYIRKMTASGRS